MVKSTKPFKSAEDVKKFGKGLLSKLKKAFSGYDEWRRRAIVKSKTKVVDWWGKVMPDKKNTKINKVKRRYRLNHDTMSLNSDEYCAKDPLFPFSIGEEMPEDRRKLRKKWSSICR